MVHGMGKFQLCALLLFLTSVSCIQQQLREPGVSNNILAPTDTLPVNPIAAGKGALLLTRFKSYDDFKAIVRMKYFENSLTIGRFTNIGHEVQITYQNAGHEITSILKSGVSEFDFIRARDGSFWDRVRLVLKSPYALLHRGDMLRIEILGRRRDYMFGEGDLAFYDLAETMVYNISDDDLTLMPSEDLSEKGYLNTFNHITAQAFITSIYSEEIADFVADVHERYHHPELITGDFTDDLRSDLENGPVDNYIDLLNNEWGQELGKQLKEKYHLTRHTYWTPELLADYLNDVQDYYSWAFQIGFKPFKSTDEKVIRFSKKINSVNKDVYAFRKYYY